MAKIGRPKLYNTKAQKAEAYRKNAERYSRMREKNGDRRVTIWMGEAAHATMVQLQACLSSVDKPATIKETIERCIAFSWLHKDSKSDSL